MRESPFYQEILAEGRAEGELRTGRANVLAALASRLGEEAVAEFHDELETITDTSRLTELLLAATKRRSVGGFRRALRRRDM
jgi:predicted transposase YdaD